MIDTHCHIDLYDAPEDVARNAENRRITTIAVTYLPTHFQQSELSLTAFKYVRPALGLHPSAVHEHPKELPLFFKLIPHTAFIGEIGLDFSRPGRSTRERQEESFTAILDALRAIPRFITLHSRAAEDAVLGHLKNAGIAPVVFHWFSGTRAQLCRVLDAGHLVSLNTAMIRTSKWVELLEFVPRSSVLTESDGPFARHAGRAAYPTDISVVLEWLATQWSLSVAGVEDQVAENFDKMMRTVQPSMALPQQLSMD